MASTPLVRPRVKTDSQSIKVTNTLVNIDANDIVYIFFLKVGFYHQFMTPNWLGAHASYMNSAHLKTTEQLTFVRGSVNFAALLNFPMIPGGIFTSETRLIIKIVVSHDVSIGTTQDSDISYGVSDGERFVGFVTADKNNYINAAPCFGFESISGATVIGWRQISHTSPRPSDNHYPGQFAITLKLDENLGSCYTAHDGGFVKTAVYINRLMLNNGLTLEVYKGNKEEKVGIKYIEVTVIQDV